MYQVVEIKGDMEPWWFLEGWQEDIISTKEFENFQDQEDKYWCEECNEYLQVYRSIALLYDWQEIPEEKHRPGYEKQNDLPNHAHCRIKR